jgi:hypothetical protein
MSSLQARTFLVLCEGSVASQSSVACSKQYCTISAIGDAAAAAAATERTVEWGEVSHELFPAQ